MNKEIVKRLIHSSDYRDVEIGIELSFQLDFEDFDELFSSQININRNGGKWYVFGRKSKEIHIATNVICVYNYITYDINNNDYDPSLWEFKGYQNY